MMSDALYFLADAWIRVKPTSIQNCWDHTNILNFRTNKESIDDDELLPTTELPLDNDLVEELNNIISDLPGNKDSEGRRMATTLDELDLYADESTLIVVLPKTVDFLEEGNEDEEEEEIVDTKLIRADLKRSYETILYYYTAFDDKDNAMLKVITRKLDEIRTEEAAERKQSNFCDYFAPRKH